MYGRIVVCFITFIGLSSSADVFDHNNNIHCFPWLTVVQVSEFQAKPYFVKLHRCQGSVGSESPRIKSCVAKTWNNVTVQLTTSGEENEITMKNHTSCKGECTPCHSNFFVHNKDSCTCTCNHQQAPSGHECGKNYAWDSENCECVCKLREGDGGHKKRFVKKNCELVCKRKCPANLEQNPDTCRCFKSSPVEGEQGGGSNKTHQGKILAALVIGEFVLLYLIFDFLLYSKKTGLMYYVRCKCRGKPTEERDQNQSEARRCLDEDGSNNVPRNVVVESNGQSRVTTDSLQHVTST